MMLPIPFLSARPLRWALWLLLLCAAVAPVQAQLTVQMQIKRRMFTVHEPLLATVIIGNMTGRDVMLADTQEGGPWFSFNIVSAEGVNIPPRAANYELDPLLIKPGETVKRTVNLNELYELGEYGTFRVKANIYFPEMGRYFSSRLDQFVLTEGRKIWQETVGVPDGVEPGGNRVFTLLTMEHERTKMLYVRVEGVEDGTVYCCYNLGRMVEGVPPDAKFDSGNNLAVLQLNGQKQYLLSRIGVNGQFFGQSTYVTLKAQPYLRRSPEGAMQIVGAVRQQQESVAQAGPAEPAPKLSDRPPGF